MARTKWTKDDLRQGAQLAAIFVAIGAVMGLLSRHGVITGAIAGLLLFGLVIGVGSIAGGKR
jgi:hypothetical protein